MTKFLRTDNTAKRIVGVYFKVETDTDPDLSYLGEYSNTPGPNAIDREERGDRGRGEFRYFNCAMSGEESGNPESPEQDYQRAEAFNRGAWSMVFVVAEAVVSIDGIRQRLTSGGLGGVEDDSGADYFKELEQEQLAELYGVLRSAGFTAKQIRAAFKDVKTA